MNRFLLILVVIICLLVGGCSYKLNLQKVGKNEFVMNVEPISAKAKENLKKAVNQQKSKKETPKTKIANKVTSSHVEVKTEFNQGSGIVIKRNNVVYVLTTAHGLIQPNKIKEVEKEGTKNDTKNDTKEEENKNKNNKKSGLLNKFNSYDYSFDDINIKENNKNFHLVDIIEPSKNIINYNHDDVNNIRSLGGFNIQTKNITISKKKFTQSRCVESKVRANVVAIDTLYDIAILRVLDADGLDVDSADFYSGVDRIPIGTKVLHCGNILGRLPESLTEGIVSHNSRASGVYLQLDLYAFFGSSGGGIFDKKTGKCVGMVRSIYRPNITMAMSIEFIRIWAKTRNLDNLFE